MNLNQLQERIDLLIRVYRFTRYNDYLSIGQRICLTMERAACMHAIDLIKETGIDKAKPKYTLPPELYSKVRFLNNKALAH